MTHRDKITALIDDVIAAKATITLTADALFHQDTDKSHECTAALGLAAGKLEEVIAGLQAFPRDLSEKSLTTV